MVTKITNIRVEKPDNVVIAELSEYRVRATRLLRSTDWTQLLDANIPDGTRRAFAEWRTELKDFIIQLDTEWKNFTKETAAARLEAFENSVPAYREEEENNLSNFVEKIEARLQELEDKKAAGNVEGVVTVPTLAEFLKRIVVGADASLEAIAKSIPLEKLKKLALVSMKKVYHRYMFYQHERFDSEYLRTKYEQAMKLLGATESLSDAEISLILSEATGRKEKPEKTARRVIEARNRWYETVVREDREFYALLREMKSCKTKKSLIKKYSSAISKYSAHGVLNILDNLDMDEI